jgi:primosomal replication protein N
VPGANRLTIDATFAECSDLRYTPAGIPALDCVLKHGSTQAEAGGQRRVDCEIAAIAFGDLAIALAKVPIGTLLRCTGFLARRYRTGITLLLHVNEFETLDNALEGN